MDEVKVKLERITDFWNYYVWNYDIIQNQVLWNKEVRTNYYGDILSYFNDTFDLVSKKPEAGGFKDGIFYFTGLLQVVYIHQDIMDELLKIFKIRNSLKNDKNPNREIRNELIGHPISREGKTRTLKSSTFFGNHLTSDRLHYLRYTSSNNFRMEEKSYSVDDIVANHKEYLDKYFDLILGKIKNILTKYERQLRELDEMLENEVDFNKIIDLVAQRFEGIFEHSWLYREQILKECYRRTDEHIRYKYAVDYFKNELKSHLTDTYSSISEIITGEREWTKLESEPMPEIKFIKASSKSTKAGEKPNDYHYELGKLHEKHPIFGISYFKKAFKDNSEIMAELENMESNIDSELEYYSSYFYLKHLIKKTLL